MGRPTKYRAEYVEQVLKLCAAFGATGAEIGAFLGVTEKTVITWMQKYPAFAEATRLGKDVADERVVHSLYQRAIGYSHAAEKVFCVNGKIVRAQTVQHYPPDTAAGIWWTKNRQPDKWRDRREEPGDGDDLPAPVKVEVTVVDGRRKRA